jgi:hypothetical protein
MSDENRSRDFLVGLALDHECQNFVIKGFKVCQYFPHLAGATPSAGFRQVVLAPEDVTTVELIEHSSKGLKALVYGNVRVSTNLVRTNKARVRCVIRKHDELCPIRTCLDQSAAPLAKRLNVHLGVKEDEVWLQLHDPRDHFVDITDMADQLITRCLRTHCVDRKTNDIARREQDDPLRG